MLASAEHKTSINLILNKLARCNRANKYLLKPLYINQQVNIYCGQILKYYISLNSTMNKIYSFQNSRIDIMGTHEKPMFFASQTAKASGYINTRDAIISHVWKENKTSEKNID